MGKREQEVSAVDPVAEMRKRVNEAIQTKIRAVVETWQAQQDEKLEELASLYEKLKLLQEKKANLETERTTMLKSFLGAGSKGFSEVDSRLMSVEDDIGRLQKRFDELFARLTSVPDFDFRFLNIFTLIEGVHGKAKDR